MTSEKKQEKNTSRVDTRIFHRFPFQPLVRRGTAFPGMFQSASLGQGLDFYKLREYKIGDNPIRIHWNHYAKTGELATREDTFKNALQIWLAQDLSSSMNFGKKPELVKAFYAFLNHLLHEGGNALGIIAFTDKVTLFRRPATNPRALKTIEKLLDDDLARPGLVGRETCISAACSFLAKHLKSGDVVFMISDIFSSENLAEQFLPFRLCTEFIPVVVRDPAEPEKSLGNIRISYEDMETGRKSSALGKDNTYLYDEELQGMFKKFFPGYLWLEAENFEDAIRVIAEWLYKRTFMK